MKREWIYTDNFILKIIFIFLSYIFLILHKIKYGLYSNGILKKTRLNKSLVISVGNITAGGTGKTPFTIFITNLLKNKGYKVCVLFRAYNSEKKYGEVYNGKDFLMNIEQSGDEPHIIAKNTEVPVFIGKYRDKTALLIEKKYAPDFIVMDDAFQYWKLYRDIDIVCVDSSEYFYNKRLLPAGILREPVNNIRRASMVVIKDDGNDREVNIDKIIPYFKNKNRIWCMKYNIILNNDIEEGNNLLIAGIAKPDSFFKKTGSLIGTDSKIITMSFKDHHKYDEFDIKKIKKIIAENKIKNIICTEKDYYKLCDYIENLNFMKIDIQIKGEGIYETIVDLCFTGRH